MDEDLSGLCSAKLISERLVWKEILTAQQIADI
jgi:hypothetical protein